MYLSKSEYLFKKAKTMIPGGVNSPVRSFSTVGGIPPFIKRGKGAFVWDEDGNKYIDFLGSWGPMILGHSHPSVIEAIQMAAEQGTSFGAPTEKEIILTEMIIDRVPGCEMVRLVNSGTEACMSAVRLARGITGRDKIVKFEGCYHGHGDSFLIAAGSGSLTLGKPDSLGVTKGTAENTLIAQFNDIGSVMELFNGHENNIAAVIIEPVNGNTGCIPPESDFLHKLKSLCLSNQSLLIFDEIMTGFRIARGGAAEYYNVTPDLYTFGKVIGGGLPIGGYGGSKKYMEYVAPVGPVYQAGTLSGNPIAVSAGIETLKHLNSGAYEELENISSYFADKLQTVIDENEYPICQSRVGTMFSLFFHPGPIRNAHDVRQCDLEGFNHYFHTLLNNGVYVSPSQYEVGFISLSHTREIIDVSLDEVSQALSKIYIQV